jgi:hypothetical protein
MRVGSGVIATHWLAISGGASAVDAFAAVHAESASAASQTQFLKRTPAIRMLLISPADCGERETRRRRNYEAGK